MQFKINDALERCLLKDRFHFKKTFQRISSMPDFDDEKSNGDDEKLLAFEKLLVKIDKSQTLRNARAESVPKISYPDLPVADKRELIKQTIDEIKWLSLLVRQDQVKQPKFQKCVLS